MKKLFALAILALLFSCNQNDDDNSPSFNENFLLKGWAYETMWTNGNEIPYPHHDGCYKDHFGLVNSATQPNQFSELIFDLQDCGISQTNLEYKLKGNKVALYFGTYHIGDIKVVELTDTFFHGIIEADLDGDGNKDKQEFTASPYDPYNMFDSGD